MGRQEFQSGNYKHGKKPLGWIRFGADHGAVVSFWIFPAPGFVVLDEYSGKCHFSAAESFSWEKRGHGGQDLHSSRSLLWHRSPFSLFSWILGVPVVRKAGYLVGKCLFQLPMECDFPQALELVCGWCFLAPRVVVWNLGCEKSGNTLDRKPGCSILESPFPIVGLVRSSPPTFWE